MAVAVLCSYVVGNANGNSTQLCSDDDLRLAAAPQCAALASGPRRLSALHCRPVVMRERERERDSQ